MRPRRGLSRRSFLGRVVGSAGAGGSLGLVGGPAEAQRRGFSGLNDADAGVAADPGCGGRGARGSQFCSPAQIAAEAQVPTGNLTGITDGDRGPAADRSNQGRGAAAPRRAYTGITDADSGASADPGNYGRRRTGRLACTDADVGAGADPPGKGRRC